MVPWVLVIGYLLHFDSPNSHGASDGVGWSGVGVKANFFAEIDLLNYKVFSFRIEPAKVFNVMHRSAGDW
jgi:hypothetical protein